MAAGQPRLSEQLRKAIRDSEVSRYRIAEATGISQSTLSLFCAGKRGLSMDAIDRLVDFLGWTVGPIQRPGNKR
ncbi:MAG: helix-turn-helix domain-containing protein [Planctomycetota bacterium]